MNGNGLNNKDYSRTMNKPMISLSLGAGVQSSTLAAKASKGEILDWDDWHKQRISELGNEDRMIEALLRLRPGMDIDVECKVSVKPDVAIFGDTTDESGTVYNWLDWLETILDFPVVRVSRGSLSKSALTMKETADGRLYSKTDIPFFTIHNDGTQGKIRLRGCRS